MSDTQADANTANADPSTTIITSVSIYYGILAVGLLCFEIARRYFRSTYDLRREQWPKTKANSCLGWVPMVVAIKDDQIMDRCGLDTLTFFRFLRLGQKFSLLALACAIILLPLYATENGSSASDPLVKITMTNLSVNNKKLWASVACTFLLCSYMMYLLWKEYKFYVDRRHETLSASMSAQYTVVMHDLPMELRTKETLREYLERIFPDQVKNIYVAVECGNLEKMVHERVIVRNRLEHALAEYDRSGQRPKVRPAGCCGCFSSGCINTSKEDAITLYQSRLNTLNNLVASEIKMIDNAQQKLARAVEDYEHGCLSPAFDYRTSPTDRIEKHLRNTFKDTIDGGRIDGKQTQDRETEIDVSPDYVQMSESPTNVSKCNKEEHMRKWQFSKLAHSEGVEVKEPVKVMRPAAFVSFNNLATAHICQQALQSRHPTRILVEPAPHVDDVNWENVGAGFKKRAMWRLISTCFTALLVLFWTIPVAFVASLTTTEALRTQLPFLNKWVDKNPILLDVFNQIGPLALAAMNALAPAIFRFLSKKEGYISETQVRASFFTKLAYFQLIQIFFVTIVVGTILDSVKELIDQPSRLVTMLGKSMPQQSTFFMSYVIILTGLNLIIELVRARPLILAGIFALCAPKLTEREREGKWLLGSQRITKAETFDPTSILADCFLVMLVSMTFATIAPLVCLFTGFFFFAADAIYRRQVLFVYEPMNFAMGAYWPYLFRFMIVALVLSQLTLLGLLSVKKAIGPPILMFILIFAILLYASYMGNLYPKVAANLSLMECIHIDDLRRKQYPDANLDFLHDVYYQPAMREGMLSAEYEMQNSAEERIRPVVDQSSPPRVVKSQTTF